MPATPFEQAIEVVRKHALERFNTASGQIPSLSKPLPPNATADEKRQHAADLLKAQNEMAAALQQLGQLEEMISEKRGREGYDAVVTLMEQTQLAASDVCGKLKNLTADPNTASQFAMLTNVLLALARLSPASIWQKDATSSDQAD